MNCWVPVPATMVAVAGVTAMLLSVKFEPTYKVAVCVADGVPTLVAGSAYAAPTAVSVATALLSPVELAAYV